MMTYSASSSWTPTVSLAAAGGLCAGISITSEAAVELRILELQGFERGLEGGEVVRVLARPRRAGHHALLQRPRWDGQERMEPLVAGDPRVGCVGLG
eukprot:scaffold121006_cov69-Phaeocystis_antarctica.AAC.6